MTFYVEATAESTDKVVSGTEVVQVLRKKLRTNADLFDFKVSQINTLGKQFLYFHFFSVHSFLILVSTGMYSQNYKCHCCIVVCT